MNDQDALAIAALRGLCLDMPARARSGHSGTAMALAPLGWLLYSRVLRHHPAQPVWANRDRLVLSSGHACVLLYGLLHMCGYDLSLDDLKAFRTVGSRTPGHPESWVTPGVDFSTGPLGQGLAAAVGMAWAERLLAEQFGSELVDHFTYVICSDGDLMEGVTAEASSLAGHQRLGKLIVFYDDNRVTIDGPTSASWSEDVPARYRAYGWQVLEVPSGEDLDALERAVTAAQGDPRPTLVVVPTVIGFPAPTMQGRCEAHSPHFAEDEIRATKEILGLDPERSFFVPDICLELAGPRLEAAWQARVTDEWRRWHSRALPDDWQSPQFDGPVATRVAGGQVLAELRRCLPQLRGGSADLAGSTNVSGLSFGVREAAMAAVCNGMAAHGGLIPYGSTYFAFSDQMKPALRLAALAGLPTISVWTHDSLALGEDGPTHQPVEQLATLRALPNFLVFRPADAYETTRCWELAIQSRRPVGLVLSRQTLPLLDSRGAVERGAYVLREGSGVTLLATGSEVHLCLAAADLLQTRGQDCRVVSMPCWELFAEQDPEYRREVLGEGPRLAVEAAASLGWHRWVGERGDVLALDRFGGSAPGDTLMRHFGFTPEHVCQAALALLEVSCR